MPGDPGFGQLPHHYLAGGPYSLLELALPFLFLVLLFVLLAVARWGRQRAEVFWNNRKRSAVPVPAANGKALVAKPVLASDLEREETTRLVSDAIGEGRLSLEEGGQRIDAVLRSRHRHELAGLVADLPPVSAATAARSFTSTPLRLGLLGVAAAALLAAVLVQAIAGLWELWPLAVAAFGASALSPRR